MFTCITIRTSTTIQYHHALTMDSTNPEMRPRSSCKWMKWGKRLAPDWLALITPFRDVDPNTQPVWRAPRQIQTTTLCDPTSRRSFVDTAKIIGSIERCAGARPMRIELVAAKTTGGHRIAPRRWIMRFDRTRSGHSLSR